MNAIATTASLLTNMTHNELLAHAELNAATPLELALFSALKEFDADTLSIVGKARDVVEAHTRDELNAAMDTLAGAFRK